MPRWDIRPAEARAVVSRAESEAREFEFQRSQMSGALTEAPALTGSELVAAALGRYAASASGDMGFLVRDSTAAVRGAREAVQAYVDGDREMADNARNAHGQAPSPHLPGGFSSERFRAGGRR